MPAPVLYILMSNLEVDPSEVYRTGKPLSLKRLMGLCALDRPELKIRALRAGYSGRARGSRR